MLTVDVSIARHFADLPVPRVDRTKKHALCDVLVIALCAVIAGADSWEEVEAFGEAKHDWLRRFLTMPNGVPSHDTFYRVFARLDLAAFGKCVADFDVAFRADANKTVAGHAGTNLGLARRVAASLLKQDAEKGSIKAKRLRAGWDDDYRLRAIQGFVEN